ncbi:ligand-gated channel protein [Parapusillimonas granuli]|uniref:Ligand-gated channel protein n=1 Tax=Parapusillimonas granuli TaxID=380911 RepID=A0A853G1R1_9BURK|nr:ligand-gated channel protein [Parapusillimonas granuli]MBB5213568.1 outer membrane receptor for ferrienterochelin and colicins [Parapusillimonas granuli]MEB2398661.1 ligand-gated channel protein [Alcaligenaceae bacterium]NYT48406.1 ligand-gated channel protein [Parapusillimonas granuli]
MSSNTVRALCSVSLLSLSSVAVGQDAQAPVTRLDNVVVTATGFEQMVEDAPASITVIPRAELEKKAFKDVTDALKDVPGVVITGGASSSDISVRGMAPSYTMILVDGKRQNSRETRPNSDGPGIEQGWLPPMQAIERIEVIRGPMSSLYGSDAMGGVVNIITRKVPKAWTGSLRNEGTVQQDSDSGNIYQSNFYLAGPLVDDKLGLQVYGQKARRQEDEILNGFNKQDATSGTVKLSLTPNKDHDLIAEFSRTLQERTSTPGKSMAALDSRGRPNSISSTKYDKNVYSLTHVGRWGKATSNTYVQREEIDNPTRQMDLRNTVFNTQWNLPLGSHMVSGGFHYQKEGLNDQGNQYDPTVSKLDRYQWALFAEDEWAITEDFALTTGVRMTRDENYGTHWTPRLYGVWHTTENLSFKGGISTGFRAPSLRQAVADWGQITGGGGGVPAIIVGNPNLKPEKSISQEFGVVWDDRQGWSSSLTFFNTDFKDKISETRRCTDPNGLPNCHVFPGDQGYKFISDRVNVDRANIRGIEATTTWSLRDDMRLSANYTYTHSKQKSGDFEGQPLNKMPKHMFNTTFDWDANERLGLWTRVNFRGKTSDYLNRTAMANGTPSFTFVDLGVNYKLNKNVNFGVGVYNVFDKRVTDEAFEAVYDGRRYWAQLTVGF